MGTDPRSHLNAEGTPHSGVMIAVSLPPDVAEALAGQFPGGEDPSEHHVTVAYLGKGHDVDHSDVSAALSATMHLAPKVGTVSRYGTFEVDPEFNDGFPYVHVALVSLPGFDRFRSELSRTLAARGAVDHPRPRGHLEHHLVLTGCTAS